MFPDGDLIRMQQAQSAHMPDTCRRLAHSRTQSSSGATKDVWTEVTVDISCGIDQDKQRQDAEKIESRKTLVQNEAVVRLPLSQAGQWNIKDKLRLTHRFGTAITPIDYDLVSPEIAGPSAIRFKLKVTET